MNRYVKYFTDNKCMNTLAYGKKLLRKYNAIWDKISNLFKKRFDGEPMHNVKYIKTKI